jgi:hypothetical protein
MHTHALTTIDTAGLGALQRRGLIVGAIGLVLGAVGVVLHPGDFLPSWLIGFLFFSGLSLGCLGLLMLQHMTGGQWGLVGRRVFEAGSRMLPLAALFFIPIVLFAPKLFLWARPEAVQTDAILQAKSGYLNVPFFAARGAIYFVVFLGLAYFLNKWSTEQDRGAVAQTEADTRRFRVISAPGLLIYVILMSLAAVDWIMSLDPHWYSTIFGLIIVVGQGLGALAFTVAVLAVVVTREPMNTVLKARHFHDFGKLMLAFVMLWAYFSFSQFLIIWAGNLPEEIPYYLERMRHGWQYLSLILVFGHFILPFCLLLSQDLKKRPKLLARIAWFIVAIRLYDLIWLVAPTFAHGEGRLPISLANIGIPLALGGLWVYLVAGQLQKRPMLPVNDPYFKDMLLHGNQGGH